MEPLIEFVAAPPKHRGDVSEELLQRDEVEKFIKYIDRKKTDPADYTAKNWREIMSKPNQLLGFGKLGDWYQYVQHKCAFLSFYEGFDEQLSTPLLQHVEPLSIKKLQSGRNPKAFDWFNVDESYELDEPQFNVREAYLTFKINISNNEYVILNATSCYWDRYSSEGQHVGKCGKMDVAVVQSTVQKLADWNGVTILQHDNTQDLDCNEEAQDEPVQLSVNFFMTLSALLNVDKEQLVKFVLDTCHYPFTKWDWNNELPKEKANITASETPFNRFQHIQDEITQNMPNVIKLFQKGYTEINEHIKLLEHFQRLIQSTMLNLHCKKMMHVSLKEDRYYDFSAAEILVDNTTWFEVSDSSSEFAINIFDENDMFEFTLYVDLTIGKDEYDDYHAEIKLTLMHLKTEEMKQKLRDIFHQYEDAISCGTYSKCSCKVWEDDPDEDAPFQVMCLIGHLREHKVPEQSVVMEIMELMHLDWGFNQFWKFLIDMGCMEEEETVRDEDRWLPEFFESYIDFGKYEDEWEYEKYKSEEFSGESADDGEDTPMDLEEELNEIKMDVVITSTSECGRARRSKKNEQPPPKRQKATIDKAKSQLRRDQK